jgi:hypothetical protein
VYEDAERPDPYSEYRAGFEMRTRKRCARVETRTHAGVDRLVRSVRFSSSCPSRSAASVDCAVSRTWSTIWSMTARNAVGSFSRVVMS